MKRTTLFQATEKGDSDADDRPVTERSALLGHKDGRTTLMIYAHAMPCSDVDATAGIEEWLAGSSSTRHSHGRAIQSACESGREFASRLL
jgi:hypothetical protein